MCSANSFVIFIISYVRQIFFFENYIFCYVRRLKDHFVKHCWAFYFHSSLCYSLELISNFANFISQSRVEEWTYDDGGQKPLSNEWVFEGDSGQHTKEFKSLHDLSYGPEHYYTDAKQCTQRPKQPMNASLKCTTTTNSCKATCLKDYAFPNGETSLYITCDNGVWNEIPSCERKCCQRKSLNVVDFNEIFSIAVCMPQCQNNGICLQPGECTCPENFVGPYCEQEKKLCLAPPSLVSYSVLCMFINRLRLTNL